MPATGATDKTPPDLTQLMDAVSKSINLLVKADDAAREIPAVLRLLAGTFGCSRAFLFHLRSNEPLTLYPFHITGPLSGQETTGDVNGLVAFAEEEPWRSLSADPTPLTPWLNRLATGRPVLIDDTAHSPGDDEEILTLLVGTGVKAVILLPVQQRGELIGFLGFDRLDEPYRWHPDQARLLTVAAQAMGSILIYSNVVETLAVEIQKYQEVLDNIEDGYYEVDLSGRLILFNEPLRRILNYPPGELAGRHYRRLMEKEDARHLHRAFSRVYREGRPARGIEWAVVTKDGRRRYVEASASLIRQTDGTPSGFRGIVRDITGRKEAEDTIKHLAYHDGLTGLLNRTAFQDRLEKAISQSRRSDEGLAVLFIDLDQFKMINDALGHTAGDQCLREVAARLQRCLRTGDVVARFGGDEFVVLLHDTPTREQVLQVIRRLTEAVEQPWTHRDYEFYLTVSIGIAMFPDDGTDADMLLNMADNAMYQAKEEENVNSYRFASPTQNATAYERMLLESRLRHAIKHGELKLHYQPKVRIDSGHITGLEALVRWRDPLQGLVFPADFISLAEQSGLIVDIGDWVLHEACSMARKLQDEGMGPLRMGVNLSAVQVYHGDLPAKVQAILKEYGLTPQWLEFELTESVAMQDVKLTNQVLSELDQMGIKLALDDFGTGYCSLAYLRHFPFHTLKIDQSFVREITTDPHSDAIIRAITVMGRSLKLTVLAEGVETLDQLRFLQEHGCQEIQGYLFSGPRPQKELLPLLHREPSPLIPSTPATGSHRLY